MKKPVRLKYSRGLAELAREPAALVESEAGNRLEQMLAAWECYTNHMCYKSRHSVAGESHSANNGAPFDHPAVDTLTTYESSTEPVSTECWLQSFLMSQAALRRFSLHYYST